MKTLTAFYIDIMHIYYYILCEKFFVFRICRVEFDFCFFFPFLSLCLFFSLSLCYTIFVWCFLRCLPFDSVERTKKKQNKIFYARSTSRLSINTNKTSQIVVALRLSFVSFLLLQITEKFWNGIGEEISFSEQNKLFRCHTDSTVLCRYV